MQRCWVTVLSGNNANDLHSMSNNVKTKAACEWLPIAWFSFANFDAWRILAKRNSQKIQKQKIRPTFTTLKTNRIGLLCRHAEQKFLIVDTRNCRNFVSSSKNGREREKLFVRLTMCESMEITFGCSQTRVHTFDECARSFSNKMNDFLNAIKAFYNEIIELGLIWHRNEDIKRTSTSKDEENQEFSIGIFPVFRQNKSMKFGLILTNDFRCYRRVFGHH